MTSGTGSGLVSRNKEGTQIVLTRFPVEGETLTSFGLTPSIIKTIAIPNDIQDWPTSALNGCSALEKISVFGMPAKEATIEISLDHELYKLKNLKFIDLPSTIQKIADGYFSSSSSDGSGNIFPRSLKSVNFQECSFLQRIGTHSFYLCQMVPHFFNCRSLKEISDHMLSYCHTLTTLSFSGCTSLETLGGANFYYSSSLTVLDLSGATSLRTIGWEDFSHCPKLTTVFLPASIVSIASSAFAGDENIKTVFWASGSQLGGSAIFPAEVNHIYNFNS